MGNLARVAASLLIVAGAAAALDCLCIKPYRCNLIEQRGEARTSADWEITLQTNHPWRAMVGARRSLDLITPCLDDCSANVGMLMLAGANYRILHRYDEAAEAYRRALRYDRRPEIYFNLGQTEVAAGQREQAVADLVMAGRSGGYTNYIDDPLIQAEVERRLAAIHPIP